MKPIAYEVILILRSVPKDELAAIIRRCCMGVFQRGGFLRRLDYLGLQKTPYRLSKNKIPHWEANYFYYEFHLPKALVPDLYNEYLRDVDIVKHTFTVKRKEDIDYDACTFEEEMKPVPYRPQVQKLIEATKEFERRLTKRRVKLNTNTDFYPFSR